MVVELPIDCQPIRHGLQLVDRVVGKLTIRIPNVVDLCDAIYEGLELKINPDGDVRVKLSKVAKP